MWNLDILFQNFRKIQEFKFFTEASDSSFFIGRMNDNSAELSSKSYFDE